MYRVKTLRLFFNSTSVCTCITYYLAAAAAKAIPSINCLKSGRKKKNCTENRVGTKQRLEEV